MFSRLRNRNPEPEEGQTMTDVHPTTDIGAHLTGRTAGPADTARMLDETGDRITDLADRLAALACPSPEVDDALAAADRIGDRARDLGRLRALARSRRSSADLWRAAVDALNAAEVALERADETLDPGADAAAVAVVAGFRSDVAVWRAHAEQATDATTGLADGLDALADDALRLHQQVLGSRNSTMILPGGKVARWGQDLSRIVDAMRAEARGIRRRGGR